MKHPHLLMAALAAVSLSSAAVAQDRDHDRHDDRNNRGDHGERHAPAPARAVHVEEHHDGRGAGPEHNFYRGGRLPAEYRSRQYVVDDWRGHRLSAPPRGYHWVQTGGDYVLAAIATGVIASVLLDH